MMPDPNSSGGKGFLFRWYGQLLVAIQTPYGVWLMFWLSFAESSFFPIPPDIFLMALCVAVPQRSFFFAAVCSAGSVLGGAAGYGLGWGFMDTVGTKIMSWYGLTEKFTVVQGLYQRYDALAIGAAGFTPLPYKLFTLTAGAFKINFVTFILTSLVARSARFFLVAAFIRRFGPGIRTFIERYFNLLTIILLLLLIGGYAIVKLFF